LAGDAGGTSWTKISPHVLNSSYTCEQGTIGSIPSIIAGGAYGIYVNHADDASGATWSGERLKIGQGMYGSIVELEGKPAACFMTYKDLPNWESTWDLCFVTAQDAEGSAWNPPVVVDSLGDTGFYCQMVVVNGHPVICYFDQTNRQLKAAYLE
jgi:hypothetical protein